MRNKYLPWEIYWELTILSDFSVWKYRAVNCECTCWRQVKKTIWWLATNLTKHNIVYCWKPAQHFKKTWNKIQYNYTRKDKIIKKENPKKEVFWLLFIFAIFIFIYIIVKQYA